MSATELIAPLAAFAATAVTLPLLMSLSARGWLLDRPNARSLHATATPRIGGLSVAAGVAAGLALQGAIPTVILLALCLCALSLLDDWKGLSPAIRLLGHLAAAGALVSLNLSGHPLWLKVAFVVLIVWMTNLYNFMDGADGLAGGMAFFGFGSYAVASWIAGDANLAVTCGVIAMAAAGFLLFNFPPARVFLGDAGSIPLGFLAGGIGLLGWNAQYWPFWFPLVIFSPFVVDASITLMRRGLVGERVWHAHRTHYYQRLVLMGWTHARLAGMSYGLMGLCATAGLLALHLPDSGTFAILAGLALAYGAVALKVDRRWRERVSK
ncbi:MAG: glycosyltransferase family 4 protein [Burkholderiales bacterium]|nr:glycosyltransferase family 4 protein [Burkholderiales bacterium]